MKKENCFYKTIKIEFSPDKEAEEMLLKNCEYRHFLYNKYVEIVKKNQEKHPDGHIKVNKYELLSIIRNTYEKTSLNRPSYLEDYDYYFRGISECVINDIETTIMKIISKRSMGELSDIRFQKYDPNNQSFRFKNKLIKWKDGFSGNRLILSDNPYIIGLKINKNYSKQRIYLGLNLKESIDKFNLDINKINEIIEARTFGYLKDLETFQKMGYSKGVTIENTVGLTEDGYTTELRSEFEPVKHKILDIIGDLYLTGTNPLKLNAKILVKEAGHFLHAECAKIVKEQL